MEDYLYHKYIFLPLGEIENKSMSMKDEECEVLDKKALGTIRLSLPMYVAFNISKEKTTKDFMDALVMVVSNLVSGSNTLKFNDIVNVILSEEMRQKRTCETSGNALTVEKKGRQKDIR
jgi:hypothetical protein